MSQFFYKYSDWELTKGPVRGKLRDDIEANKMKTTASTNLDSDNINSNIINNSINNSIINNNNNDIDNYNASQEDTATVAANQHSSNNTVANVDKPELTLLGRAVDVRRSYELDKIWRHKMEAAEDIERYKKEKLQKLQAKEEEKRKDVYKTPKTDYRKQKWNHTGLGDWPTNYATQPQEYVTPTQATMSPSLRWPLDLKQLNTGEGIEKEITPPEKDKLALIEPTEHCDTDIQFHLKNQNQGQENTQNMGQEQKIVDSSSNGHKRKYVSSEPNPICPGLVSPRTKRTPSPSEVMRARAARVYMEELKKGMAEQRKKKEEMEKECRAPVGELATVMGKGRVGRPRRDPLTGLLLDNHLRTSDVSKDKIGALDENPVEKAKYGHDLIHAAEERYRMKELEKLKSKQQEIQHQETYNELWGRPGGGAPRAAKLGNRMAKLDNTLYKDILALKSDNTGKLSFENNEQRNSPSVRYSTHLNHYDYPNNLKEFKGYSFRTPWANFY